jgi:AsmA protein
MKRALKIIGIVVAILIVVVIALPFVVNVNSFRPKLESELSTALGRPVTIGNLGLSILGGSVSAQDLAIADDPAFSKEPFIRAKELRVGVELVPLILSKKLIVTELTLEQPKITLIHSAAGPWNFSSLGASSAPTAPEKTSAPAPAAGAAPSGGAAGGASAAESLSVQKLDVKDGRITMGQVGSSKTRVYDNVNVSVRDFSLGGQFPFTLSADLPKGGSLKLDGTAGPINASDTSLTPLQAQLSVKHLDLAASGIGEFSPGLAGMADFDGKVSSDGKVARTSGTVQANNLKLVEHGAPAGRPVQLKYATEYGLRTQEGQLTQGDITMGKALARLTGAYKLQGEKALLNMKLNAQNMPVDDLEAMLPALGVVLPSGSRLSGGTLSTTLAISGPADNPVITGPIKLANSKLAGFDLGSKLSAISKLSGAKTGSDTTIENLSTDAHMGPEGISTQKVNLTIPALGVLTGSGTISPGGALDYKMNASLSGTVISGVTKLAGMGNSSGAGIPFFIRGTTANPSFVPDVKGMVNNQIGGIANTLKSRFGGQTSSGQKSSTDSVVEGITGLFQKKKK